MNTHTRIRAFVSLASLLTVCLGPAPKASTDDLWHDVARRAWKEHGQRYLKDYIRTQIKTKIAQSLADLKNNAPVEFADSLNTLGNTIINAQNMDELVDAMIEGRGLKFDKASEQYAKVVAQHIAMIAEKDKHHGAKLLKYLANRTSKVKEISQSLGAAAEGDLTKGAEWLGNAIIEYVCPPIAPWITAAKAAYGAMSFVRDVYTDRSMESLYQSYKAILEKQGPAAAERWVHERFTVGGDELFALRTRMDEIRKAREEAYSATGLKGDRIRELVNEEALIRNIILTMNARHRREQAEAIHQAERNKAEQRAKRALEYLNDEMILRHGRDWYKTIQFSDDDLAAYLAEVERLIREEGLDEAAACRLQALRLAYGLAGEKTKDFLREIASSLRVKNKALTLSTRGGAKIHFHAPPRHEKVLKPGMVLTEVSGSWKEKLSEPDPPYKYGPFDVPSAGKLSAELEGTPAVPARWSLFNWNTTLTVIFEPKLGHLHGPGDAILTLRGQAGDHKFAGQAEWPSAGRLTIFCGPPLGGGPLTGGQFQQTFRGKVVISELRPESLLRAGQIIDPGDRIHLGRTDEVVLHLRGTYLRATKNADLILKLRTSSLNEVPYFELNKGTVRVVRSPSSPTPPLELQFNLTNRAATTTDPAMPTLRQYRITPFGTDYELTINDDGTSSVHVFHGAVRVHNDADQSFWVDAGETLHLPQNTTSDSSGAVDLGCLVGGAIRIDQIPVDTEPQRFGTILGDFAEDRVSGSWLWQDPGSDVTLRTPHAGVLELTVPNNNDFAESRDQGPRLLHKVTGDFDFTIEVEPHCQGSHGAAFDFVVFAPGSYVGALSRQFEFDGHLAHFKKLGGWSLQQGKSKLAVFQRQDPDDWPEAPNRPIKFRLQRMDDEFVSFWSLDGIHWTLCQRDFLPLPETIWVGASFIRIAWDRQPDRAASYRVQNVQIKSMERGTLKRPPWYFVQPEGKAFSNNQAVRLEFTPDKLGEIRAISSQALREEFDVAVRFRIEGPERTEGDSVMIQLAAVSATGKDAISVYWVETPRTARRYSSSVLIQNSWRLHQFAPTTELNGGLRLTREKGVWRAYYWKDAGWSAFEKPWNEPINGPFYLHLVATNKLDSKQPYAFAVDLRIDNTEKRETNGGTAGSIRDLKELSKVQRIPEFDGDFSYTAFEDRIILARPDHKSAVVGVAGPGKSVGASFRQFVSAQPAVATLLGEAVSLEMSLLGNSVAVQVFEGGALVRERATNKIWWNAHPKRPRGLRPGDELTRYPEVRFGGRLYEISVRGSNVSVIDLMDKQEMKIAVSEPGKVIPPDFARVIEDAGVKEGLGQAVSNVENLFNTGAGIQVYEGGAVILDPSSKQFWWCRHVKRGSTKTTVDISLPKDPNAIVIQLDYVGGYTPPRKTKDPFLRIRADGQVALISPFGQHPPIETRISQENILNFLKFAIEDHRFLSLNSKELARAIQSEAKKQRTPMVADLPTTVIAIRVGDRVHEVRCEAPEFYAEHLKGLKDLQDFSAICQRLEKYMEALRGP